MFKLSCFFSDYVLGYLGDRLEQQYVFSLAVVYDIFYRRGRRERREREVRDE
ncbi:hypothetical protein [Microcoleus sp. EPA2]|jgi:hypothetical protein|uniref:hypothetical protein n=1 Tax=Microcoleus sp. EPA2 TaxID=2841654 RepID=UPI00312BC072